MPRRRPEFKPGEADVEAAKLKKFSDADGSQIQRLSDAGRFTLFEREQYIQLLQKSGDSFIVVGLLRDLWHEFSIDHAIVFV